MEVEELAFGFDWDFDLDAEDVLVEVSDFSDGFEELEDLIHVA